MRKIACALLLLLFCSSLSFGQEDNAKYDQETAIVALDSVQRLIRVGKLENLEPALLNYLYDNRAQFPFVSNDATIEERMGLIIPVYTQITEILKWSIPNSPVAITADQARLMVILGYQSVNLMQAANEFIGTVAKDDPSYDVRIGGYNQAVTGVQTFLKGYVVSTFIENQNEEMDSILVGNINEFGPDLIEEIPQGKRKEIVDSINEDFYGKVNARLNKDFKKLIKLLGKKT